jgi:cysteine dioxygenase
MKTVIDISPAVGKISEKIENCKHVDNDWLVRMLKEAKLKYEDFSQFQNFNHDPALSYGRTVVCEAPKFMIYVMSWAPGDFTAIHSHGYSDWGSVVFFADTNHNLYHANGNKIVLAEKSIIPKGTVVPVIGDFVHAMGNLSDKPFITLHIYGSDKGISNANDYSRVFEIEKKQIRTTNGAAYLNIDEELCKKTEKGLLTNVETLVDYLQIILPFYKRNNLSNVVRTIEGYLKSPESYFTDNQFNI